MKMVRDSMELKDSATVVINSIAQQKAEAGIRVFNLSVGEPKLPPHSIIVRAVSKALEEGKTFYPPVSGLSELKKLASEWMNMTYGCHFHSENCLVVNGGKLGIYLLLQLLLQRNDEVIINAPYWVSYPTIIKLFGALPVVIETEEATGWKLTAHQLRAACTPRSKILILNNGCNPTGTLYTKDELATLLEIAKEQDLLVLSDEVYSGLTYDNNRYVSCGAFSEHRQRVVIIQSCSKNFSMTGWRIGFVFAPTRLIKKLTALVSQSTSGVTTISQWAAVAALRQVNTLTPWVQKNMERRRNSLIKVLCDSFRAEVIPPPSSLYLFISLSQLGVKNMSSVDFCTLVLEQANVALVPGLAFGKDGFVRISFGASEHDLKGGVSALADFCRKNF